MQILVKDMDDELVRIAVEVDQATRIICMKADELIQMQEYYAQIFGDTNEPEAVGVN